MAVTSAAFSSLTARSEELPQYNIVCPGDSITYGDTLLDPSTQAAALRCGESLAGRFQAAVIVIHYPIWHSAIAALFSCAATHAASQTWTAKVNSTWDTTTANANATVAVALSGSSGLTTDGPGTLTLIGTNNLGSPPEAVADGIKLILQTIAKEMPAFPSGCRVIFQGDEITAGDHWPATKDFNHNFGQDYVCLIASQYGKLYPENQVVFLNQGVKGNAVSDLAARWQKDTIDAQPDLLSILIGSNDKESIDEFSQRYDKLLADTVAALPKVQLLLCEPFMLPSPDSAMAARIKVVAQLASRYHAAVVPLQRAFEDALKRHGDAKWWLADGRHPTAAGEQIVADAWLRSAVAFYHQQTSEKPGGGGTVPPASAVDELPAFPVGSRILFQGDSITDGRANGSSEFGQCYPYFIAANYSARHPERKVTFINHGISGNKVNDLAARWQKDTIDVHPDLLSIFIGINDGNNIEELEPKYDKLLADTIAALPHTQLVICEMIARPFNDPDGTTVWSARTKLVARLGAKYHLPVAHFQQAMNEAYQRYGQNDYWIWDGVHPSAAGQQILADEWLRAVAPIYRDNGVK